VEPTACTDHRVQPESSEDIALWLTDEFTQVRGPKI
jgi:hypothetical protein